MSEIDLARNAESDISATKPVTVELGGENVVLNYSMASLHYLTSKYPDLPTFLKKASGDGRPGTERITQEFVDAICDFIYAGIYQPGDDGNDTSGWSVFKVMRNIGMQDLNRLAESAWAAFNRGAPTIKPDAQSADQGSGDPH